MKKISRRELQEYGLMLSIKGLLAVGDRTFNNKSTLNELLNVYKASKLHVPKDSIKIKELETHIAIINDMIEKRSKLKYTSKIKNLLKILDYITKDNQDFIAQYREYQSKMNIKHKKEE